MLSGCFETVIGGSFNDNTQSDVKAALIPTVGDDDAGLIQALTQAKHELAMEHPPQTRALSLQKSAVVLAEAYCGVIKPREVRNIAKKILLEAGFVEDDKSDRAMPSDRSISKWLKEIRDRDAAFNDRLAKAVFVVD